MHVPFLCDVEVTAGIRRALIRRRVTEQRVAEVLVDYLDLSMTRHPHTGYHTRVLELRNNFTAYDAAYVALAEALGADVLTADEPLARAVRAHTDLTVLP